jgi:DNA-binding CsgD family transcriptional regulator
MDLLERDAEREALRALARDVAAGGAGVAVLDGPAGSGKSALLAELTAGEPPGVRVLATSASPLARDVVFGVARRLLDPAVRAEPALLESGWPRQARPLFAGPPAEPSAAATLIDGLIALVAELALGGPPVLLVVDDAHWADAASLAFLAELAARAGEVAAGIVLAVRTDEPGGGDPALDRLRGQPGAHHLRPAPLSGAAVGALVAASLPGAATRFAERVAARTGGNPLLVREVLAAVATGDAERIPLPESVTRAVQLRLDAMDAEARALAAAAAVGGEVPLRIGAELAGLPGDVAARCADELTARGILEPGEPLTFVHGLVADAAAAGVPAFRRAAIHGQVARLLAAEGTPDDDVAAHLLESTPAADAWAAATLRRTGVSALRRGQPASAARLLARALAEPPPAESRGELLVELAQAEAAAGRPEAFASFERALECAGPPARRAAAWHGLSRLLFLRDDHRGAAEAAARGRAELAPGDPAAEQLMADELSAASLVPDLAPAAAAETLRVACVDPPPADPLLLAHVVVTLAWVGVAIDRVSALARAAVARDPLVDLETRGFALSYVAGGLNMTDAPDVALELLDPGIERAIALGDPLAEAHLRACRAWARFYLGRIDEAADDLEAVAAQRPPDWAGVDAVAAPPAVAIALARGDLDAARAALARAAHSALPGLDWFRGAVALEAGNARAALAAFRAAGEQLEDGLGMRNPGVLPWRSGAALAAHRLGAIELAASLAAEEIEQARAVGVPRALGVALRTAGLVGGDETLLAESVEVLERSPARLELAQSLLALGTVQRLARRPRDARPALGGALDLAPECGATALEARALDELAAAGARPRRRPRHGPDSLTAAERRVAVLAAQQLSTREIAGALFLSPKTVEGHLTRAYRKLGVSGRSELAAVLSGRD